MITKFVGKNHEIQRLYIHWDLLTVCNYNCNYCYAKRFYEPNNKWNLKSNFETQKYIIKCISNSSLPVFLGLLGGEPTLDTNFEKIVYLIYEQILTKHHRNRLYITTNLSNPNKIIKLNSNEKVFVLASLHPQANFEDFIENIKKLKFKTKINLMLIDDPRLYKKFHKSYELLSNLNVEIHPHFVYEDHSRGSLALYSSNFYNEFKYMKQIKDFEISEIEETYGVSKTTEISDFELFEKDLNHFYGFNCYNNNYEIDFEGNVKILCKNTKESLLKNPLYFKNIKTIEPMICPHQNCNCDGLLKVLKTNSK